MSKVRILGLLFIMVLFLSTAGNVFATSILMTVWDNGGTEVTGNPMSLTTNQVYTVGVGDPFGAPLNSIEFYFSVSSGQWTNFGYSVNVTDWSTVTYSCYTDGIANHIRCVRTGGAAGEGLKSISAWAKLTNAQSPSQMSGRIRDLSNVQYTTNRQY